jgi:hypothetical protein
MRNEGIFAIPEGHFACVSRAVKVTVSGALQAQQGSPVRPDSMAQGDKRPKRAVADYNFSPMRADTTQRDCARNSILRSTRVIHAKVKDLDQYFGGRRLTGTS